MKQNTTFGKIELDVELKDVINYVSVHNGVPVVDSLTLKNTGREVSAPLTLKISGFYFLAVAIEVPPIKAGNSVEVDTAAVIPSIDRLASLCDAVYTELTLTVMSADKEQLTLRLPLTIQAWNHWHGSADAVSQSELASFVMPHHEYVAEIVSKASELLRRDGADNSIEGYSAPDNHRFMRQLEAVWQAVVEQRLRYLTCSSEFYFGGQKIVTLDLIRRFRQGNCLDLSLLLCSCLERMDLAAAMVFVPGHVMVGVWVNPDFAPAQPVITDPKQILRNVLGNKEGSRLLLIESTMMRDRCSIDDAQTSALQTISAIEPTILIDITAARKAGIKPLPFAASSVAMAPYEKVEITGCVAEPPANTARRDNWERKLLDLTMRNPMLNIRCRKTFLHIARENVDDIVAHLRAGRLIELFDTSDSEVATRIKSLYRTSRLNMEESGANTLFLALTSLDWCDVDDNVMRTAPLIFIPLEIVRKKAMAYEIRMREDEPMLNVTLVEMLRRMFGFKFAELDSLPLDGEDFPDWKRLAAMFNEHIVEINKTQAPGLRWKVTTKSYVGIFSFTKYLMWSDIHTHPEVIDRHPVLRSFIDGFYSAPQEAGITPDKIEYTFSTELMLPLPYDSSQLKAVYESHFGSSFVLHGPPGTGKSQTITNMIADAIFSGKRVLFVAEKKAALDVVRSRLNSLGLERYCLELHSNKTDKRSFFSQIDRSGIDIIGRGDVCAVAPNPAIESLQRFRDNIENVANAIHSPGAAGISLYECICNFITSRYTDIAFTYADISHLTPARINEYCAEIASLDVIGRMLGFHPGDSALVGLYPKQNTVENQRQLSDTLNAMPGAIAKARKKAVGLINRWFVHKSAEDILAENPLWQQLQELANIPGGLESGIDAIESSIARWRGAADSLRKWYLVSDKVNTLYAYNLAKPIDYYLDNHSGADTAHHTSTGYYSTIAGHIIDTDPNLRGFYGSMHQKSIDAFCEASDAFMAHRRHELEAVMKNNQASMSLSEEAAAQRALLVRRCQSNGRGVSLRKIIAESEQVVHKIFPCMLMSPLSVAQYLEMRPDMFDLVIFDEASQMETCDAVGAIARGSSLIVVGDPRQLPPTRFFTAQTPTGEEVEESEDADSILEDCIAVGMPSHYLSRHYRSRHESLIAFSNRFIYDNKLLTFPSANDSELKVTLVDPEGTYDCGRSRTNAVEAQAVVRRIISLLSKPGPAPSIGVVAFSKPQSNLIEDLLGAELQAHKKLQQKLDEAAEPLFIKNLENVQGDERDIIIFSIGYGPDAHGNVSMNFGPVNISGGERRLNVAVSRAREEMVVFSSLKPYHIPAGGLHSKGVATLRAFLEYAQGQAQPGGESAAPARIHDAVVEDIAGALRARGLQVRTNIGRSSFKIDIAIVSRTDPHLYDYGIIIDGKNYYELPTVRDREITIPQVLQNLGWKLKRVWVIDWLENPALVLESLLGDINLTAQPNGEGFRPEAFVDKTVAESPAVAAGGQAE